MARLLRTNDGRYRCNNCFICLEEPKPICPFCDSILTNYESLMIENFYYEKEGEKND